jgi:asparagine synthetase B (glutamine-hydrolysing)
MNELKKIFINELNKICADKKNIGIALSSGIDSNSVMFGLLELGKKITAYSFHVEGIMSKDYLNAKRNAKIFGINFVECIMPNQVRLEIVKEIIKKYNKYKKTDIECIYPFYFLLNKVKEKILITGACADGHFCLSKNGMIHHRHTIEKIRKFRLKLFNNPDYAQTKTINRIGEEKYGIRIDTPFNKKSIIDWFMDKEWNEINRPKQKQPIIDMFENFKYINRYPHTNLQCGDSKIRELFSPLLKTKLNIRNRKRVIDLYRDIYAMGL